MFYLRCHLHLHPWVQAAIQSLSAIWVFLYPYLQAHVKFFSYCIDVTHLIVYEIVLHTHLVRVVMMVALSVFSLLDISHVVLIRVCFTFTCDIFFKMLM